MRLIEKQARNMARKNMTKKAWKRAMNSERKEIMPRPTVFVDKRYSEKYKRIDEWL